MKRALRGPFAVSGARGGTDREAKRRPPTSRPPDREPRGVAGPGPAPRARPKVLDAHPAGASDGGVPGARPWPSPPGTPSSRRWTACADWSCRRAVRRHHGGVAGWKRHGGLGSHGRWSWRTGVHRLCCPRGALRMTPEVALLLTVLLVGFPLLLWLGSHAREEGTSEDVFLDGGFWVCPQCRSVNLPNRSRCYACRADRASARHPSADPGTGRVTAPRRAPVAVMDPDLRPGARDPALAALPSPPSKGVTGPAGPASSSGAVPASVLAAGRASVKAASPALGQSTRPGPRPPPPVVVAPRPPVPVVMAPPPGTRIPARGLSARPAAPASSRVAVAVCPYLRLAGDRETWHGFPCDANRCHAESVAGPTGSRLGRLVRRSIKAPGPQAIPHHTQQRLCLTPAHVTCERYADAAAGRTPRR
jgi:hypothetical protein